MGALINFYSAGRKRRTRLRREQEEEAKLRLSETPTPELASLLVEETLQEAPVPAQAAAPPTQTNQGAVVGVWLLPNGKDDYGKIPIRDKYSINKSLELASKGPSFTRPALALLPIWQKLVQTVPSFRNHLPKNMAYILKSKDKSAIDTALEEMEQTFIRIGSTVYFFDGAEANVYVPQRVPSYWREFVEELNGQSNQQPTSLRIPKPTKVMVHFGTRPIEMSFQQIVDTCDKGFQQWDEIRSYVIKANARANNATPQQAPASTTPAGAAPSPTIDGNIFEDNELEPLIDPVWLTNNLQPHVDDFIKKGGDATTVLPKLKGYLRELADSNRKNISQLTHTSRSSTDPALTAYRNRVVSHVNAYHALKAAYDHLQIRFNPTTGLFEEGWTSLQDLLMEVTFRKLLSLTQINGQYRKGGLVRVGNVWVTDPNVKGRTQNALFVVTRPPAYTTDSDGFVRIDYNFKSKPDRSTTGMRQKGYIKFIPPGMLKKVLRKFGVFKPKSELDADVHVFCTCPDFKYRWHKVLSDKDASHRPTGQGGEAIDKSPVITNPSSKLSLCKHLTAVSRYLSMTTTDLSDMLDKRAKEMKNITPLGPNKAPQVNTNAAVDAAS